MVDGEAPGQVGDGEVRRGSPLRRGRGGLGGARSVGGGRRRAGKSAPRHLTEGTQRFELPVSKMTWNSCAGVPIETGP